MKIVKVSTLMALFFYLISTAQATEGEVRELCVEKTVNSCLAQCEKTNKIDCTEACQENAQNQCRQAGE